MQHRNAVTSQFLCRRMQRDKAAQLRPSMNRPLLWEKSRYQYNSITDGEPWNFENNYINVMYNFGFFFFFFIIQIAYTVPDKESMCIFMFPMIGKWNLMV